MGFYLVVALWEGLANSTAATPALKRVPHTLIRNSVGEIFTLILLVWIVSQKTLVWRQIWLKLKSED